MRFLAILSLLVGAAFMCGCSSSPEEGPEKKLEGKPEVKEMPPGTAAPGDSRPSQADESRDGG